MSDRNACLVRYGIPYTDSDGLFAAPQVLAKLLGVEVTLVMTWCRDKTQRSSWMPLRYRVVRSANSHVVVLLEGFVERASAFNPTLDHEQLSSLFMHAVRATARQDTKLGKLARAALSRHKTSTAEAKQPEAAT